jgi:GDPmannose 4,6-dehydratase
VRIDPRYLRPAEVDTLLGDASRARAELGWVPRVGFEELVREMIESDLALARRDVLVASEGYRVARARE